MVKKEHTPPPMSAEPIVPSDIYYVKVWRQIGEDDTHWTLVVNQKTSAQSPHGAMKGIIDADAAKQMLANKRAVDAED